MNALLFLKVKPLIYMPGYICRTVQAGSGGSGRLSYTMDRNQAYGKADGGDGGSGGHVIFKGKLITQYYVIIGITGNMLMDRTVSVTH